MLQRYEIDMYDRRTGQLVLVHQCEAQNGLIAKAEASKNHPSTVAGEIRETVDRQAAVITARMPHSLRRYLNDYAADCRISVNQLVLASICHTIETAIKQPEKRGLCIGGRLYTRVEGTSILRQQPLPEPTGSGERSNQATPAVA